MQKIGIIFDTCQAVDDRTRIALMQKHGFEATFMMSNDPLLEKRVLLLREAGIAIDNCHAPFNGINPMWLPTEMGERMLWHLTDGLEKCARHEIPALIVHLSSGDTPPRVCDVGLSRFDRLIARAEELGVSIAFENQRKLGNLALAMEY